MSLSQCSRFTPAPAKERGPRVLKKITILNSSNIVLTDHYRRLKIPASIKDRDYVKLRDYVEERVNLSRYDDPEIIIRALEWVSTQWKHDGMNEPPRGTSSYDILQNVARGQRYRCVEYGQVLSDLLLSRGYISRKVGLKDANVAYGGFGMAHAASEVWSNKLQKWIFLDPQFGMYVKRGRDYLNFHEIYLLKKKGEFDTVEFTPTGGYLKYHDTTASKVAALYRQFISNHFGYMDTTCILDRGTAVTLTLPLEAQTPFLTFQGLTMNNLVFTRDYQDLYFDINRVLAVLSYKNSPPFTDTMKKYSVKTEEDYMASMPLFAAEPNYTVKCLNSMPWFHHYETKTEKGPWRILAGDAFDWELAEGLNTLCLRAVNSAGLPGPETIMEVQYE